MDDASLLDYYDALRRRWRVVAAAVIVAVFLTGLYLVVVPRVYRGKALLMFSAEDSGAGLAGALSGLTDLRALVGPTQSGVHSPGTYAQVLKSRSISQQVVDDMGLSSLEIDYRDMQRQLDLTVTKDGTMDICCYAPTSWVKSGQLAWLDRKYPRMTVKEKTARLAAEIANDYVARLKEFDSLNTTSSATRQRAFVEGEAEKTKKELSKAEEAFSRFQQKHPSVPPPEASSQQVEQLVALRKLQIEAATLIGEVDHSIVQAQVTVAGQPEIQSAAKVITENPVVSELKAQLAKAEVERATLLEDRTERHPEVVGATQEIDKLRQRISLEVKQVTQSETLQLNPVRQALVQNLATLEIQRSGAEARLNGLNKAMASVEAELSGMAADELRYVRLMRDVKALEMVYTSLFAELSKAKVAEAKEPEPFTVVDYALPEKKHTSPRGLLTMIAAVLVGTLLGAFIVMIQEGAHPGNRAADRRNRPTAERLP